ncbi:MAG: hypothetical protein IIC92_07610 [Chloroflexi bacterium]|nr:hypothetical protein [Chloroflexota bacterium]
MPNHPPTPAPALTRELVDGLMAINSTAVLDVLARNGFAPHYMYMPNIRNLTPGRRLVGRAVTVRFVPFRADVEAKKPAGEESPEYAAFEEAGPGDVIVMESMRDKRMSIGGDVKFLRLKQRGIAGLICDGGVRDMHVVKDYGPAFFGLDQTSNLGTTFGFPFETNGTVNVDGVLVQPGDYLHADDDGVVVIPREVAADIARKAIEYDEMEEWIRARIDRENLSPGRYYPPDDDTIAEFKKWKSLNAG